MILGESGVETARDADPSVTIFTRDFERTPSYHTIVDRLERASRHGDVGKIATTASSRADVLDLLRATADLDAGGRRVATMAMGEAGRHSRAVAPLYGSRITYAAVDSEGGTTPSQYDLATLAELIDSLRSDP